MSKLFAVSPLQAGSVIDHIPAGFAMTIIKLLRLDLMLSPIFLGLNISSKKLGKKDLIKVHNRRLQEAQWQKIAIVAPGATINIIEQSCIVEKIKARLPQQIDSILLCPNAHCITRGEHMTSIFHVDEHKHQIQLTCKYCEHTFNRDEFEEYQS